MNDEELRAEIAARIADLDRLMPVREGWVRLRRGRGSVIVEANRAGYVRLGMMLVHAGTDASFEEPAIQSLLTPDSTVVIEKMLLRVRHHEELDPSQDRQQTIKLAATILIGTIGAIALVTVVSFVLSLLMHHHI